MEINYFGLRQRPHGSVFSAASKYLIVRRRLFFFLPITKHPKVTRLAFDRAQVLEWILRNNCNCYLVFFFSFLKNFDYPPEILPVL